MPRLIRTRSPWANPAERETCENVCFWWDISRPFPFNWSSWNVGAYMCPVDRRRYRDGDFNGQWTSQLAPSQCSGILFPPHCSFTLSLLLSALLSLSFLFSCALYSFLYIIFLLVFLPVSPLFVFSLYRSAGLSPLSPIFLSFSLFLLPDQTPDLYATWKASGLKRDITGPSFAPDTRTQKTGILSYPRRSL